MCIQIGILLGCSLRLLDAWLTQGVEGTMVKSTMGAKSQVDRDRQSAFLLEILEFDWKFWYFLKGGTYLTNYSHEPDLFEGC